MSGSGGRSERGGGNELITPELWLRKEQSIKKEKMGHFPGSPPTSESPESVGDCHSPSSNNGGDFPERPFRGNKSQHQHHSRFLGGNRIRKNEASNDDPVCKKKVKSSNSTHFKSPMGMPMLQMAAMNGKSSGRKSRGTERSTTSELNRLLLMGTNSGKQRPIAPHPPPPSVPSPGVSIILLISCKGIRE